MTLQLRDYQQRAIQSFYDYFAHSDGSPLIVLPTGAGKSLVLAGLCYEIMRAWPDQRILVLSHVQELIAQDYNKLKEYWSKAPAGIYSASLGRKQAHHPITFATIQSVFHKSLILGNRNLVFIDEAHLLGRKDNSMYNRLIADLKAINPALKVAGLTATDYRLDSGKLTEGDDRIFTDVCYELPVGYLIERGYLTRLIGKSSLIQANLEKVGLIGGEFNGKAMEAAFDQDGLTSAILDEVLALAADRRSILFFCSGIDHAHHVRDALRARGVLAEAVSGKTPKVERERILEGYKAQQFRVLCSVAVLTTGFDAPCTDCLVMLRATMSPGLYIQIAGRGMRLFPGKANCLFLDYGGNVERHGPVTHVNPPRRGRRKGERLEPPTVRICELCRTAHPLGTIECGECGNIMVRERDPLAKLDTQASDAPIVMSDAEYLEASTVWAEVDAVKYRHHRKEGKPDSLRVDYECGMMTYREWVCLLHPGFAGRKAAAWWQRRSDEPTPATIEKALATSPRLMQPTRIRVRKNDKHFEVLDYEFATPRQAELAIGA
jgi:DNA repair protein RadD